MTITDGDKKKTPLSWRTAKDILESAAFVFAIGYAIVTFLQWRDSSANFILGERAWLAPVGIKGLEQTEIKEGSSIVARITFANTGKTPAKNVDCQCSLEIPQSPDAPKLEYPDPHSEVVAGLLNPGVPLPLDVLESAPGVALYKPRLLSAGEADDLLNGRRYSVLFCKGKFTDIFQRRHWFKSCAAQTYYNHYVSYNYVSCVNYNDVGDGDLPKD
jgi:hypothetical protein